MPFDAPDLLRERAHFSRAESRELGKSLRRITSRSDLATRRHEQRDARAHLDEQNAERVPELVPLRMQRMLENPFTFYRGTAGLMAHDLARDPHSGILVAASGDAHISNFGFFASPERRLVFDLNDFDEAAIAPWEWDVKRLVTSIVVGGMHAQYAESDIRDIALAVVAAYLRNLERMTALSPTERYFMHADINFARRTLSREGKAMLKATVAAAERRTALRAVRRTTERDGDGRLRFVEQPPTMTHFDLTEGAPVNGAERSSSVAELFEQYRATVPLDVETVLTQFEPTDLARRVVGVGSVGTRCYLQLLQGSDDHALVLQVKEAGRSVLERFGGISQPERITRGVADEGEGFRVVGMQRVLQAVSDPLLGHLQANGRDFYVRQFHNMKGSVDLENQPLAAFRDYVIACGMLLARAHAQSPTAGRVIGYAGRGDLAARAIVSWSFDYARQSAADFEEVRRAVDDGPVAGTR